MKLKINLLIITILSACMHMQASDNQPTSAWQRARSRLDAAHGRTAPEIPHTESKALPSLQDVIAPADSERSFIATMRGYLSRFTGCLTWNESCESTCPSWDTEMPKFYDIKKQGGLDIFPGFDTPITCKSLLNQCYQNLRGCSQEQLDSMLIKALREESSSHPQTRCTIIALICQGANPNMIVPGPNISVPGAFPAVSPIKYAIDYNDYHLFNFLLKRGATIHDYPLVPEAYSPRILEKLLRKGANVNAACHFSGKSALHWSMFDAPQNADNRRTKILLKYKANINQLDPQGRTPLATLADNCFSYDDDSLVIEKARLLLNAGAETHHRVQKYDEKGLTALEIARKYQQRYRPCQVLADFLEEYEKHPSRLEE